MSHFDIPRLKQELEDLEKQTLDAEFWNDQKSSQKGWGRIKTLKRKCSNYEGIEKEINNLKELTE